MTSPFPQAARMCAPVHGIAGDTTQARGSGLHGEAGPSPVPSVSIESSEMSRLSRRLSQTLARIRHGATRAPRTVSEYLLQPLPHERAIRKLFERDPPRVIFDVGACEGEDSIQYRDMFPTATIYAFEPRADNLARIETHLATFGADRIHVVPVALSDREGTARLRPVVRSSPRSRRRALG